MPFSLQIDRFLPKVIVTMVIIVLGLACTENKIENSFSAADRKEIINLLAEQQKFWNNGDIPSFMLGYHRDDSMQFVGSRGITFGWEQTLNNYKMRYPDTVVMGKLQFDILKVNGLSSEAAWLTGRYNLKRSIGDATGIFTLVLRKIDGQWKIVYDHTGN